MQDIQTQHKIEYDSFFLRLAYALPQVSVAMLWTPLYVMQGVYVKYYGFSMTLLAGILLVSRLFDAVIDPVVGAISDWWKEKTGRRKPFVAIGGVLFIVAGLFLYIPPENLSGLYVTFWLVAFFTGLTVFLIPHLAWGGELAETSHDKTKIFGLHTAAGYFGLVIFYAIPQLPFFVSPEITPQTMRWSVIISAVILVPALFLCLKFVPEGKTTAYSSTVNSSVLSIRSLKAVVVNRPFLILLAAYVLASVGLGTWYGMIFIYVDIYLGMGAVFSLLYLLAFCFGAASSFLWIGLAKRLGKGRAWNVSIIVAMVAVLLTSCLTPGQSSVLLLSIVLIGTTLALVCNDLLPRSILGDIVDYATWKYGTHQGATYFSLFMFSVKASFALGGALGIGLAGWFGFEPTAVTQTQAGVRGLNIVMTWLPLALLLLALVFIRLIPIDAHRHEIIRRRMQQRDARQGRDSSSLLLERV